MLLPVLVLCGKQEEKTDLWRNGKRAYKHPLEIVGSECKDGVLRGFLGGEGLNERYFIKSDYMSDYFDILIRAMWQV